jgi:putative transcriptional regulator
LQWQIQNQDKMNRIKEILERKGVSQTDLAHRLGKTFNMVNLYATNKVQPPIPILYKIAEILDVDIRELLVSNKIDTQ